MAITNNGTKNLLPSSQIPDGYIRPSVIVVPDAVYTATYTLNVTKSVVASAVKSTTMTNIIDEGAEGITKQIDDILANDYVATNTVEAYSEMVSLKTNIHPANNATDFLNDTVISYIAEVKLYVKVS